MKKFYLVNIIQDLNPEYKNMFNMFNEGDTIVFDMPPFCSGDYKAKIYKDNLGLYINDSDNYFTGCRDFNIEKMKNEKQ